MNLLEQLKTNFEVIITNVPSDFKRITGEPQITYDLAIKYIIKKLKDLGYSKLNLAFRPLPYILVNDCEYTPIVALIIEKPKGWKMLWDNMSQKEKEVFIKELSLRQKKEYQEIERKYEDGEPRWVNGEENFEDFQDLLSNTIEKSKKEGNVWH